MDQINKELMQKIAAGLNLTYENPDDKEDTWRAILKGADDVELFFSATWASKGKYHLSGSYPKNQLGQYVRPYHKVNKTRSDGSVYETWEERKGPSIEFSPDKGAEKIILDIKRRFMPLYMGQLKAVKEKIKEENKYNNSVRAALKTVCAALSIKEPEAMDADRVYAYDAKIKTGYAIRDVRIHDSGKRVQFELELPIEKALGIFKALK